jgi:hypothetical protein
MTKFDKEIGEEVEYQEITIEDASKLPNLLGAIVPQMLKIDGEYKVTIGGTKTWFVLSK